MSSEKFRRSGRLRGGKTVDYSDQLMLKKDGKRARDEINDSEKENQLNDQKPTKKAKRIVPIEPESYTEEDSVAEEVPKPKKRTNKRKVLADKTNKQTKTAEPSNMVSEDEEQFELSKAKSICSSVKKRLSQPMFGSDLESDLDESVGGHTPGPRPEPVPYKDEYENLLRKYRELKELRTTKAEALYLEHQTNAEQREKVLQGSLDKARKDKGKAEKQLKKAKEALKELEAKQEKAEGDVVQLTRIVAFYECMTRVHVVPQGSTHFSCSCSGNNGKEAKFLMSMGEGSFEYEPVKVGDSSGEWVVPPYLQKTIYFADKEGPKWFAKLLASLYH